MSTFSHFILNYTETVFVNLDSKVHCSKKLKEHLKHIRSQREKEKTCWMWVYTDTGYHVRNERTPHRLMEIKIINLQRAEFKDVLTNHH